ncbi:hypothetical protein [Pseudonocardia phyllosphaerae]|uniref:hypothetical protein n=1 Tax=Pseudonocardia phyllosphaerae TaxID=3390502 RepID=UPI00397AF5FF
MPAPGPPADIASELATRLPNLLSERIDPGTEWHVEVHTDPLTGSGEATPEVLDGTERVRRERDWDYAVCVTDLPIFWDEKVVVTQTSRDRRIGETSVPALGTVGRRRRLQETTLRIVDEMVTGRRATGAASTHGHRLAGEVPSVRRDEASPGPGDVDVRYLAPGVVARTRLIAGMVLANQPWGIFLSMKSAMTAAFAAGASSLVFSTMWELANAFHWPHFVSLMLMSVAAMVCWIVFSHQMWERASEAGSASLARLYNTATVGTLLVAVTIAYAVLFVLLLGACFFFVPTSILESKLGQPVGIGFFFLLAWLMASIATVAGALGSGLEDDRAVVEATYGFRQQRRIEKLHERRRRKKAERYAD